MLIAMIIEDAVQDSGGEIVGPVATLEKALKLAEEEEFDAAILDVTIRGGNVYPVAELLLARGIPFVFASGGSGRAARQTASNEAFHRRRLGRANQIAVWPSPITAGHGAENLVCGDG